MAGLYKEKVDKKFDIKVEAFGFRELPDKFAAAMKTGEGLPDLVQLDEVFFGMYLHGQPPFVDLSEKIAKAKLDQTLLKNRLSVFSYGGKTYGLPQSVSAMMLYYRKDLFDENGLSREDFETWGNVKAAGKKLAETGQALMAMDPFYFEALLRQRGSDLFGPKGEIIPNEKLAVDTLKFLAELSSEGIAIMPDRGTIFDPVFFSGDIENGEVMCVLGADWYGLDMIQQFCSHLSGEWGILPLPVWDEDKVKRPTSTFSGQGLLIPSKSKNQDAAWKFMEFVITDKEANVQRFLQGNSYPAYRPAWTDPRLIKPESYFSPVSMGVLVQSMADWIPPVVMHPKRPQAVFMIRENIFASVMYGQLKPEEAVAQLKKALSR
jgi:lactose/L-arabinose transport system substrate-binding protein